MFKISSVFFSVVVSVVLLIVPVTCHHVTNCANCDGSGGVGGGGGGGGYTVVPTPEVTVLQQSEANEGILYLLRADSNVTARELWLSPLYNHYSDVYFHKGSMLNMIHQGIDFRSPLLDKWDLLNITEITLSVLNTQGDVLQSFPYNAVDKNFTDLFLTNGIPQNEPYIQFDGDFGFDFYAGGANETRDFWFATLSTTNISRGSKFVLSVNEKIRLPVTGYDGCYTPVPSDNGDTFIVQNLEECVYRCYYQEKKYAGVQDGSICSCFSVNIGIYVFDTLCNTPCIGDSQQNCGGLDFQSIYKTENTINKLGTYTEGESSIQQTLTDAANTISHSYTNDVIYITGLELRSYTNGFNLWYSKDQCWVPGINFTVYTNTSGQPEVFDQQNKRHTLTMIQAKCLMIQFLNTSDSVMLKVYRTTGSAIFAPVLAISARWQYEICQYTDILADPKLVPDTRILGWYGTSGTADPVNGWVVPVTTFPEPDPMIKIVFPGLYPVKVTNVTVIGNAETVSVQITGQCKYSGSSVSETRNSSSTTGTTVVIFDTLPCADVVKITLTNVINNINGNYLVDIMIYGCEVDILGLCGAPYKELLQEVPRYQIVEHYSRQLPNSWSIRKGGPSLQTNSFYSTDGPIITIILPPDHVDNFLVRSINITSSENVFSISYISSKNNVTFVTLPTEINSCGVMATLPEPINIYAIRITSTRTSALHTLFDFNLLVVACVLTEDFLKGQSTEFNDFCQDSLTTEATTEATTEVTTDATDNTTSGTCCECSTLTPLTTPEPMTIQEAEVKAKELRKELTVDVKTLSSTIRKKISAKDERPSSQLFGVFGVVFLVVVFGAIIVVDIPNLIRTFRSTWKIVSSYLSKLRL